MMALLGLLVLSGCPRDLAQDCGVKLLVLSVSVIARNLGILVNFVFVFLIQNWECVRQDNTCGEMVKTRD